MSNLNDIYTNTHGTSAKAFCFSLGGDPDKVISDLASQCAAPNPLATMLGVDQFATADDAHNAILCEIKRLYFSRIPRDAALSIANSLPELGAISLCSTIPELTFNAWSYADAWSNANPDQPPIRSVGCNV